MANTTLAPVNGSGARVALALDAVYARALARDTAKPRIRLDVAVDRFVLFSDLHRGARNGADDFRRTERAFNAALAYYHRLGYTLVMLGDVEELWEERSARILASYRRSYELEAAFHHDGRYLRIWGNHDDAWQFPDRVRARLQPVLGGAELMVPESLLVDVVRDGEPMGSLFLIHGHQGDQLSDRWSRLSRFLVRFLWRPLQRLTGISPNTPAESWDLSHALNRSIYAWASRHPNLVLIAGHTHRPVFRSRSHAAQIAADLAKLEGEADVPPTRAQLQAQATLRAQLAWIRADERKGSVDVRDKRLERPCYFNTGCCCYEDGDITGLEIADGQIRLIRWPDEAGDPLPNVLAATDLCDVFAACH